MIELPSFDFAHRIVSIVHLRELKDEIEKRKGKGHFPDELYRLYFSQFSCKPPTFFARSIIVAAIPSWKGRASFIWRKKKRDIQISPPFPASLDPLQKALKEILEPMGYRLERAFVPLKLLAVRSGLGFYGRNNLCYVPGMGSVLRLAAFYSDFPPPSDPWGDWQKMERCHDCFLCQKACPTGAISRDRFLLYPGLCLNFYWGNMVKFPDWLQKDWFIALRGCPYCIEACPENAEALRIPSPIQVFSEEETSLLIQTTVSFTDLPLETQDKLKAIGVEELMEVLPRNLTLLLANAG